MIFRYGSVCAIARLLVLTGLAWTFLCVPTAAGREEPGIVRGVVWNVDNTPLPNARVRLRNIETGRVAAIAETSTTGQFLFAEVRRSFYLAELVADSGKVLAVGPSFHVDPGATVSTVIRLSARRSWYAGMFSNTAVGVIAAAAHAGLTALGPTGPLPGVSTQQARPISPQ